MFSGSWTEIDQGHGPIFLRTAHHWCDRCYRPDSELERPRSAPDVAGPSRSSVIANERLAVRVLGSSCVSSNAVLALSCSRWYGLSVMRVLVTHAWRGSQLAEVSEPCVDG